MAKSKEQHFEDEVFDSLVTDGGWIAGLNDDLEFETGLATAELLTFIGQTQIDEWNKLLVQMGNDADRAQREFRKRVAAEIDKRGTVDVLRHGVKGWGLKFDLCYFKPAHSLTPLLVERYNANRLTATRQQRYSSKHANTLDLCLWVNGLAVATVELKNELTNQTVEHAKVQYRTDRDPHDPFLAKRAVVHFAVDPYLVFMTTRLAGSRDPVPAVQPRPQRPRRQPAGIGWQARDGVPVGGGLAARRVLGPPRPLCAHRDR